MVASITLYNHSPICALHRVISALFRSRRKSEAQNCFLIFTEKNERDRIQGSLVSATSQDHSWMTPVKSNTCPVVFRVRFLKTLSLSGPTSTRDIYVSLVYKHKYIYTIKYLQFVDQEEICLRTVLQCTYNLTIYKRQ